VVNVEGQGQMVDASTSKDEEGRSSLRKASGRWQATFEPGISEWGNPFRWKSGTSLPEFNRVMKITRRSETSQ